MENKIFQISKTKKIVLKITEPINEIHLFTEGTIYLVEEEKQIVLSEDSIRENMNVLNYILTRAIKGQYTLHESIKKDIGYLYNEELQEKPGLSYEKLERRDVWVGLKYNVWFNDFATWIYNNNEGAILLEITPVYPGYFDELYETSYDEWIKYYKPYLTKEISIETAQDWLQKARSILNQIDKNIEEYENRQ